MYFIYQCMCARTHDGWGRAEVGSLHLSGIRGSNSWVSLAEQGLLQAEPSLRPQDVFKPLFPPVTFSMTKERGEEKQEPVGRQKRIPSQAFKLAPLSRTNFIWNGLFCNLKQKVLVLRTKIVTHLCHTRSWWVEKKRKSIQCETTPASGLGSESWTESFAGEELLKYNPQTRLQNNIADLQQTRRIGNSGNASAHSNVY